MLLSPPTLHLEMSSLRPRLVKSAFLETGVQRRSLVNTAQRTATVIDRKVASSSSALPSSSQSEEPAPPLRPSIYGSRELLEAKKERKFAQYEKLLAEKARR